MADFNLHVFEFDDDGLPWNPRQQDESFDIIKRQLDVGPAVVVDVRARMEERRVGLQRRPLVLSRRADDSPKAETLFAGPGGTPRRVVGVYIGWRGGNIRTKGVEQLTFWGRKHTAHVVGDNGAVTALIGRLRAMVDRSRGPQRARARKSAFDVTSLVFVGHSSAVRSSTRQSRILNGSVGEAIQKATGATAVQANRDTRQRLLANVQPVTSNLPVLVPTAGDLVILVNPAMEASRFANLTQTRNLRFDAKQIPILMTVASEADSAVGGFFPIGQALATIARAARSRDIWFSMVKGFGSRALSHTPSRAQAGRGNPAAGDRRRGPAGATATWGRSATRWCFVSGGSMTT